MAQPFSVSSMFISPTQRINLSLQENQFQFNRDMAAAQVAAQPDPMMAAIGGSLSNIGGMAFGGGMGSMMGSGTKSSSPSASGSTYNLWMNQPLSAPAYESQNLFPQYGATNFGR